MSTDALFVDLIHRVRGGEEAAANELFRRYETAIRRSVRLRLDPRLRRTCDSMDICQTVLCSFFVRAGAGKFELDTPEQLLKLLATMARHKLSKARRDQQRARRDNRRQVSGGELDRQLAARGPNPSQQAEANDLLAAVQCRLSVEERQLAEMRNQGRDWAAIAVELGGSPEALRKKLARAVARLADQLGLHEVDHE